MKTSKPNLIKFRGAVYRLDDFPIPEQQDDILLAPPRGKKLLSRDEQLGLLKSSVEDWNRWYRGQAEGADLSWAELQGAELRGVNLKGVNLQGTDLYRADLSWANLQRAELQRAELLGADLSGANLQHADLQEANLRHAYLRSTDLRGANLRHVDLYRSDLQGAHYNKQTKFPQGFDPEAAGMILRT